MVFERDQKLMQIILKITVSKKFDALDKIIMLLFTKNVNINKMETEEGNLEMVFLGLTGKKLRD